MNATVAVIAKRPAPGRSKTRLTPPLSAERAAALAAAALHDTLAAVASLEHRLRKVLVLDGEPDFPTPAAIEVIPQRGGGLDERLANAFTDMSGPALIVGMDTTQLTPKLILGGVERLRSSDAVLGPAVDGGYWTIGLREPVSCAFTGVPMSTGRTCAAQRARLRELRLTISELPRLRDVDTYADALAVAAGAPSTRFAAALVAR